MYIETRSGSLVESRYGPHNREYPPGSYLYSTRRMKLSRLSHTEQWRETVNDPVMQKTSDAVCANYFPLCFLFVDFGMFFASLCAFLHVFLLL